MIWASITVGAFIALSEIDRLVASSPVAGRAAGVADVVGLRFSMPTALWARWADAAVPGLVVLQTALDAVFIVGYAGLLFLLLRRAERLVSVAGVLAALLVAADALEDVFLVAAVVRAGPAQPVDHGWIVAVYVASCVKWSALAVLVVAVVLTPALRWTVGGGARRIALALWYQRPAALGTALLALLSLVPAGTVFDQLPDVQRRWFSEDSDPWHVVWATLATLLFAAVVFVVGRARSDRAHRYYVPQENARPRERARSLPWLLVPAVLTTGGGLLVLLGGGGRWFDWRSLVTFAVAAVVVVGISGVVRPLLKSKRLMPLRNEPALPPEEKGEVLAADVATAGDVLTAAVFSVAALSLVRSLTAPVALHVDDLPSRFYALGVAVLVLVAVPVLVYSATQWVARWPGRTGAVLDPQDAHERRATTLAAPLLGALIVLVVVALWPAPISGALGVPATAAVLLAAWTAILGLVVVALQYREPLALFKLLGLRATPVVTLLVIVGTVNAWHGGDVDLHRIRQSAAQDPGPRQPLEHRFQEWLAAPSCPVPVDVPASSAVPVRPMLLLAARGGGARAAEWTALGLESLGPTGTCADTATLLSSGVSGGSVGLATAHRPRPAGAPAVDVETLTGPDALAAATAGMFGADVIGNLTGLRIPSLAPGPAEWRDRAALMEQRWEDEAPELALPVRGDERGRAGALIFNSTDGPSGCRVLVSQIKLGEHPTQGACPQELTAPGSVDYYARSFCPQELSWSTASMLSARFPFVTPAGRAPPCPGGSGDGMQLVDGGYSEGSGLGTLADLAPALMDLVRAHNSGSVAAGQPTVVPLVVDLSNGYGSDIALEPPELGIEPVIPAIARGTAIEVPNAEASWTQRLTAALQAPCVGPLESPCNRAAKAIHSQLGGPVVHVAPQTRIEVTAPLGWALSKDSRESLACNLAEGSPAPAGIRMTVLADMLGRRPGQLNVAVPRETVPGGVQPDRCRAPGYAPLAR